MRILRNYFVMALALTVSVFFVACSENDETTKPEPPASIIGEWFEDSSDDSTVLLATTKYNEDKTVEMWLGYVSTPTSLYYNFDGTYTYSNNTITTMSVSPIDGNNTTQVEEVKKLDKYTMVTYLSSQAATTELHRIVATYEMTVGNTKTFETGDADFVATSYKSCNTSVASVDGSGSISALKRGTAYICAESSIGTAVIRVVVSDPDNFIDDFAKFMGGSINDVTAVYGNNYTEVDGALVERTYGLLDETTEKVVFSYFSGKVYVANVTLRSTADKDAIVESFSKKYTVDKIGTGTATFHFMKDGSQYDITYFYSNGMIIYMLHVDTPEPETGNYPSAAFEQFDNLIMMGTANAAANAYDYTLTSEDMENGWFDIEATDNNVFTEASVMFDEDPDSDDYMKITTIMLTTKSGIKQEDIEYWYKEHYTATGDAKNPYSSSTTPVYYISFKASGSHTIVYYKFRKNK